MDSERELESLIYQLLGVDEATVPPLDFISYFNQVISFIKSMDLDSQPKPESELISLVKQIIYLFNSIPVSHPEYEFKTLVTRMISLISSLDSNPDPKQAPVPEIMLLLTQTFYYIASLPLKLSYCVERLLDLVTPKTDQPISTDVALDPESKLISLISQLLEREGSVLSPIRQVISLVISEDLEPKQPESKLLSLVSQTFSLFNSMDFDSQPESLSKFIALISQPSCTSERELESLIDVILDLEPEPEFMSLIYHISSLAISMAPKWHKLISLGPQLYARFEEGKILYTQQVVESSNRRKDCFPFAWRKFNYTGENTSHFRCKGCNGENHETYEKAPAEIKHPLHPKHSLQLVMLDVFSGTNSKCYCCNEDLREIFYCCSACDFVMNIVCVEKSPVHFLEKFNCIECEFALCFKCASLPQNVSYKHDKHMLTFSYGKETSSMIYWCEACEKVINQKKRFYSCGKYCCVTLHIKCLIGNDLYMKRGASWIYNSRKIEVLPNNQNMSRPFCSNCKKRCPYNVVFQRRGVIFCSTSCVTNYCKKYR